MQSLKSGVVLNCTKEVKLTVPEGLWGGLEALHGPSAQETHTVVILLFNFIWKLADTVGGSSPVV